MARETLIQVRSGSSSEWSAAQTSAGSTPLLQLGEIGLDTTQGKIKVGDGTTLWGALPFQGGGLTTINATSPIAYNSGTNTVSISATPSFTSVTATTFTGALSGNATTATTATKASKITASSLDRTVFVSSTTPTGMVTGDIWIKTA